MKDSQKQFGMINEYVSLTNAHKNTRNILSRIDLSLKGWLPQPACDKHKSMRS